MFRSAAPLRSLCSRENGSGGWPAVRKGGDQGGVGVVGAWRSVGSFCERLLTLPVSEQALSTLLPTRFF